MSLMDVLSCLFHSFPFSPRAHHWRLDIPWQEQSTPTQQQQSIKDI